LWENTQDKARRKTRIREGRKLHCCLLNCKTNVCVINFWDEHAASETSASTYKTTGVVTKETIIQIFIALRHFKSHEQNSSNKKADGRWRKRRSKER
jgi:hypothetical protein